MHNIHHNHHDTHHDLHHHRDNCAPNCDDQIPVKANMVRGLKGNSFKVDVHDDTDGLTPEQLQAMFNDPESAEWFNYCDETFLEGSEYDEATRTWASIWTSENINGGRLHYQYNLRPHTTPQTFTITFIYRRPGRTAWSWTTPAIPYIWSTDGDGNPDVDGVVGSGVANFFVRESVDSDWLQTERHGTKTNVPPQLPDSEFRWGQLNWPEGTEPRDFNGVAPGEAWAATLTFGHGGDIPLPNLWDLALILGWTREQLECILNGGSDCLNGGDNVKNYIDNRVSEIYEYVNNEVNTINNRIDEVENNFNNIVNQLGDKYDAAILDILDKIYLGGTFNASTGRVTWPNTNKIPIGDLNLFAGTASPTNSTITNAVRSRALSNSDIKGV